MGAALFYRDKMTNEERAQALMMGKPVDRVPFVISGSGLLALNVGNTIKQWYQDPKIAFDSGRMTSEQYGAMWLPFGGYPALGPWELGGKIKWPETEFDQCPRVDPPVSGEAAAWELTIPSSETLKELGYLPYIRSFARLASAQGLPFVIPMYCPFTTAGNIVGIDNLCRWTFKNPDLVHLLLKQSVNFLIGVCRIIVDEFGVRGFFPGLSTAGMDNRIISPKTARCFALPYLFEYTKELMKMGVMGIGFHPCGEQNLNYAFYPEIPLPSLSQISVSHEVDLERASAAFPDHVISGNIEPALLQLGSAERVYEACRVAIEKGKKHQRGFVLMSGCEMAPQTPPYNLWVMAKAVNDFGYFD